MTEIIPLSVPASPQPNSNLTSWLLFIDHSKLSLMLLINVCNLNYHRIPDWFGVETWTQAWVAAPGQGGGNYGLWNVTGWKGL